MRSEIDRLERDRWLDQLDTTISEVFEGMLGIPCLPSLPDAAHGERLKVVLSLSGEVERNFCLYFSMASAKAAVIAFAGDDSIEWEPLVDDALGEIGNIVIGSLKTKLDLGVAPFRLSLPAVSREMRVAPRAASPVDSTRDYMFLEHKLEIQLSFQAGEAPETTPAG